MVNNLLFRTDKISTQKFPSQRGAFGCVSVRFRVRVVWAKAYLFVLLYPHTIWNMNLLIFFCFWKEEGKNLHISFNKKQAHYILFELFYNKDLIAFWFKSPKNRNTIKSIMIVKIVNYKIWSSYYDKQFFLWQTSLKLPQVPRWMHRKCAAHVTTYRQREVKTKVLLRRK